MSIYAPSNEGFRSLRRISRSSIASPTWFASLVDAAEDEHAITIVFHVPEKSHGRVCVQASDRNVAVRGPTGAMRLCALPCSIAVNGVETARSGDLLRVRVPKLRPADATATSRPSGST